jgi:hypothetical protein
MDPLIAKLVPYVVAFVCLIVGTKIAIWKYGKHRCIRCYQKFRKEDVEKAPGMRGDFRICKECKEIVVALYQ